MIIFCLFLAFSFACHLFCQQSAWQCSAVFRSVFLCSPCLCYFRVMSNFSVFLLPVFCTKYVDVLCYFFLCFSHILSMFLCSFCLCSVLYMSMFCVPSFRVLPFKMSMVAMILLLDFFLLWCLWLLCSFCLYFLYYVDVSVFLLPVFCTQYIDVLCFFCLCSSRITVMFLCSSILCSAFYNVNCSDVPCSFCLCFCLYDVLVSVFLLPVFCPYYARIMSIAMGVPSAFCL